MQFPPLTAENRAVGRSIITQPNWHLVACRCFHLLRRGFLPVPMQELEEFRYAIIASSSSKESPSLRRRRALQPVADGFAQSRRRNRRNRDRLRAARIEPAQIGIKVRRRL